MSEIQREMPLDPATVDALLGSPYVHAGFRAFAHPAGARTYRLAPTPPLRVGDTVRWPARGASRPRRRPDPGPTRPFTIPGGVSLLRPRPRRGRELVVTERRPDHLTLRSSRGTTVSLWVEKGDDDEAAVLRIESGLPARATRRLVGFLEAEGRDWRHFLDCGIRPLTRDPHLDWARERRGLGGWPWELADRPAERCGFEAVLLLRHPVRSYDAAASRATWAEVAAANGVPIAPTSMWWDIAVTDAAPPPQDPYDSSDDRFGWPGDGAGGLAGIPGLFTLLARHTSTPDVAFGAMVETGSLAWDAYGPGKDHSVAIYTTDPDANVHPELTVVPASQICSPTVEMLREMPVFQLAVADVPRLAGLSPLRAHGVDGLWPSGREWLLLTDIDWPFTYLGCDRATADAVLAADGVEAVELG